MEIIKIDSHKDIEQQEDSVLVLGYFDGLHRGHKELFNQAREIAQKMQLKIVVLTFPESPQLAFTRFEPDLLNHINYPEKRYCKFAEYGVDCLYLTDFTSSFAKISSDDFIKNYIKALKAKAVVMGFDYKFSHSKANSDYLKHHFAGQVITVPEVQYEGKKISSTRVRQLIKQGDMTQVNRLLSYEFSTRGIVVHGDARGRTIGFPTANLAPLDRTYLPADGVYVADVIVGRKRYRSMTSIGKNITFGGTELRLEANIFDFDDDIYGETIEIFWLNKIREMVKFNSVNDLVEQLKSDKEIAINWGKS
ncbi:bifunctional riboflavin kinase/FAD synthetase [Streptococcus mutans]|uniref:bifunctional riboflavin kinase/FAD synthetase n=1 Tax=Streptococcus mutans TaxID=1309 RepID=UPI001455B09C|nr:bifunctional riboflavin kinase/FAD synthetase [Streptococcus mutans]NLQ39392.1 bifunctional riboflavin kinase/FAD synthetase [Streptococcus mutans]